VVGERPELAETGSGGRVAPTSGGREREEAGELTPGFGEVGAVAR
jgi:hypothetical protein